jgi:60 kDa SS-A/Ro ribonucleoprotein
VWNIGNKGAGRHKIGGRDITFKEVREVNKVKKIARSRASVASLPSNAKAASVNRAGGVAFEVNDPALKLITMTGGSFFAEPRFYNAEACVPKRGTGGKFEKLAERLEIVDGKLKGFVTCDELPETAREVIATAIDVANGKTPEDMLAIANWLRNEMNIRMTPQILLVLASQMGGTKSLVRKYATHIVKRPDEVKTCLLIHRFLFGLKNLPNGLASGLADATSKFGERGLMKYDDSGFPTWKDVLCWLPRKAGWPLSAEVAKYFITGKIDDPAKTPIISARKELVKKTVFDTEARDLAKKSQVNWEVLLSQFGKEKNKVWSFLIDNGLIGYMALLRNLRNILEAKVAKGVIQKVSDKLSNKDEVAKSKQLPFRFLSAKTVLDTMSGGFDHADYSEVVAAIELAANEACANIPVMSGETMVFADNSGSMTSAKLSEKSAQDCRDAANMLSGIAAKVCERPYLFAFGSSLQEIRFAKTDTVMGICDKVKRSGDGGSTNGHLCIEHLIKSGKTPARVIILTDCQMWNDNSNGGGQPFANAWAKYRKSSKAAAETWLHIVHLNGYGDSPVCDGDHVNQIGGFSEKIFSMMLQTEGLAGAEVLPTVDQVRLAWTVK